MQIGMLDWHFEHKIPISMMAYLSECNSIHTSILSAVCGVIESVVIVQFRKIEGY